MAKTELRQQLPHERILVIKPSSLGDIVHALPVLAALREAYPAAHIAWLVGNAFAPLLEGHPLLDEVIPFDRRRYGRMLQSPRILRDFLRFVADLRRQRFDLVVDLQGLIRSGFLAWASGARRRVGFAAAREFAWLFYSERIRCPATDRHAVAKNLRVAQALGLHVETPEFPLGLRDEELTAARTLLTAAAGRPLPSFTTLIVGARWETKRWRVDRLAGLIDRLHAEGYPPCVMVGSPDDRTFADRILQACPTPVVNLVGRTTLRELCAVIALSVLVISHDSGPMHIAAALRKPLVALFGPTDPERTGPYCDSARVVALPLPCAPCLRRHCPLNHHACMQQLELETVLGHVRELWARARVATGR